MSLLALAVGGRGLVDPDEPVLHVDDEAFLRRARERAEEQRRAYERRQRAERAEEAGEQKDPEEG